MKQHKNVRNTSKINTFVCLVSTSHFIVTLAFSVPVLLSLTIPNGILACFHLTLFNLIQTFYLMAFLDLTSRILNEPVLAYSSVFINIDCRNSLALVNKFVARI